MKFEALVIDGDNICWKNYFANSDLSYNGKKTGAIFGTIKSILSYHKRFQPSFMIITWTQSNKKRKEIYPQYKATRKTEDRSDYFLQQQSVELMLSYMGIIQGKIDGFEADDIMANVSDELDRTGYKTLIISSDKDMLQMVNDNIFTLRNDKLYNSLLVFEEFGCRPEDIPLWLAIKGDRSDNIKGVNGIGEVRLKRLFQAYGSQLEYIIMSPDYSATVEDRDLTKLRSEKEKIKLNLSITRLFTKDVYADQNTIFTDQSDGKALELIEYFGMHSLIKDVVGYINENKLNS